MEMSSNNRMDNLLQIFINNHKSGNIINANRLNRDYFYTLAQKYNVITDLKNLENAIRVNPTGEMNGKNIKDTKSYIEDAIKNAILDNIIAKSSISLDDIVSNIKKYTADFSVDQDKIDQLNDSIKKIQASDLVKNLDFEKDLQILLNEKYRENNILGDVGMIDKHFKTIGNKHLNNVDNSEVLSDISKNLTNKALLNNIDESLKSQDTSISDKYILNLYQHIRDGKEPEYSKISPPNDEKFVQKIANIYYCNPSIESVKEKIMECVYHMTHNYFTGKENNKNANNISNINDILDTVKEQNKSTFEKFCDLFSCFSSNTVTPQSNITIKDVKSEMKEGTVYQLPINQYKKLHQYIKMQNGIEFNDENHTISLKHKRETMRVEDYKSIS